MGWTAVTGVLLAVTSITAGISALRWPRYHDERGVAALWAVVFLWTAIASAVLLLMAYGIVAWTQMRLLVVVLVTLATGFLIWMVWAVARAGSQHMR